MQSFDITTLRLWLLSTCLIATLSIYYITQLPIWEQKGFYTARTPVEKRLHSIIRGEIVAPSLFQCISEHPSRCDKAITKELLAAIAAAEMEALGGSPYEAGDLGLSYNPIVCANNYPDYEWHFLYHTVSQNENTAIIEYAWSPELTWQIAGRYKLIKRGDSWLLDGILCYPDMNFHFY